MRIEIDTADASPTVLRATAAYLLALSGDIPLDDIFSKSNVPTGTQKPPRAPTGPAPAPSDVPPAAPSKDPWPPAPPPPAATESNVLPFSAPTAAQPAEVSAVSTMAATVTTAAFAPSVAAPAAAPTAPLEFDKSGMPWDARIHQKGKSRKKDGTWKLQKGIDSALVQAVTTELAGAMLRTAPPAPAMTPDVAALVAANPTVLPAPPPPPSIVAEAPAPPPPAALPATAPAASLPLVEPGIATAGLATADSSAAISFPDFVQKLVAAVAAKKITESEVLSIARAQGAPNLPALAASPHLIPAVNAAIDAALFGK